MENRQILVAAIRACATREELEMFLTMEWKLSELYEKMGIV